jgi:hypothetical protein
MFFSDTFKRAIKKTVFISSVFILFILSIILKKSETGYHSESFIVMTDNFCEYACDVFFGSSIFFPEIISSKTTISTEHISDIIIHNVSVDFYRHWYQYLFVTVFYALIVSAAFVNRKNRLVQMLLLLFGVDIFIHIIVQFGLTESFIYGGHWVYCLPLLLGWLFGCVSDKKTLKTSLIAVTSVLLAGLIANNIVRLTDFIHLALKYWGAC